MINHCNNFIEVSLEINQKISLLKIIWETKVFLKYLKSLDFDINKYPKNSKTLIEFKSFKENWRRIIFSLKKTDLLKTLK